MCVLSHFSRVLLFVIPWTVAHQAPLTMGISRQEYWSGLPWPPPGDLPDPGTEPESPASPALQAGSLPAEPPGKPIFSVTHFTKHCIPYHISTLQETYYMGVFILLS